MISASPHEIYGSNAFGYSIHFDTRMGNRIVLPVIILKRALDNQLVALKSDFLASRIIYFIRMISLIINSILCNRNQFNIILYQVLCVGRFELHLTGPFQIGLSTLLRQQTSMPCLITCHNLGFKFNKG